jgi:hypothetical protein
MRRNETQNIASLHRTMPWSSMVSICRDAIFCVSILRLLVDYGVVACIVDGVIVETQYIASLRKFSNKHQTMFHVEHLPYLPT